MKKHKDNYYVNNREFYNEMVEWLKLRKKNPTEPIPDCIGEKIYKIVNRYSYRPNFSNYTYKDKFISEALYTCIRYADRFDPKKYDNPFAYFTRIAWSSFVKCILEERKVSKLKKKMIDIYRAENDFVSNNQDSNMDNVNIPDKEPEDWAPLTITTKEGKKLKFEKKEVYDEYIKSKNKKSKK